MNQLGQILLGLSERACILVDAAGILFDADTVVGAYYSVEVVVLL